MIRRFSATTSHARRTFAALAWLAACIGPGPATAATLVVNSASDSGATSCGGTCELRAAVLQSASGDTITFDAALDGTTIQLAAGEIAITDKDLAIIGNGADRTVISGGDVSRIFAIQSSGAPAAMQVTLSDLTLTRGFAGANASGGALHVSKPNTDASVLEVDIERAVIRDSAAGSSANSTYSQGGGIYSRRAVLRIADSAILGNTAYGPGANGGGILATGSFASGADALAGKTLTIVNSTIARNSVSGTATTGGGVEFAFGDTWILNSTIAGNSAARGANVHNGNASTVGFPFALWNSIVADADPLSDPAAPNIGGPISDARFDLLEDDAGATYTGTSTGVITGVDPQLDGLDDNGGPTPTMLPAATSAAVDAGDPDGCTDDAGAAITADQRGSPRPAGSVCDIGAYERLDLSLSPTTLPDAVIGVPYSVVIGTTPTAGVHYAVTAGSLAPFALDAATGELAGTGTATGPLDFTVTAIDAWGNIGTHAYVLQVVSGQPASLTVDSFPSPTTAGATHSVRVTARDASGNVAIAYAGTIHFASSDTQADLPADYTFTAADAGTRLFDVTLRTAGTQSIRATDTVDGSLDGTQTGIVVEPAAAAVLALSGFPTSVTAGTPGSFDIVATDAFGNVATGYAGTLHFTSSDPAATLPVDAQLANGTGTFNATLHTVGTQSITATDNANPALAATQHGIVVEAGPAVAFSVGGHPSPTIAGEAHDFTVTARDAAGNIATGYAGTVHFASSDTQAELPADATLTDGSGTFSATLRTSGTQSISVIDGAIAGTQAGIVVEAATASTMVVDGHPSPVTAGTSNAFNVTLLDAFGNIATGYTGTVHFTASDTQAALPADYAFTTADA